MPAPLTSYATAVENAVQSGDHSRRVEMLRRVTNLFVEQAPHLGESNVAIFDEIILRIARNLEFQARVALAEQLADVANAPLTVLRDLALDDHIGVAKPVLERSPRLSEDDLVEVAACKGQGHLLALSVRPALSPRVTDVLVDRGDESVVRSVARNEGAQFSHQGFERMLDKARRDPELQSALSDRADVPREHLATLMAVARERVREVLSAELGSQAGELLERMLGSLDVLPPAQPGALLLAAARDEAQRTVDKAALAGRLGEEQVAAWLKGGEVAPALIALSDLAGVSVDAVVRAYHAPSYDPLLFLVRGVRFGWGTFKLFLHAKAGRLPPADLLRRAFDGFEHLSVATAQRILKFTTLRDKAAAPDNPAGPHEP